MQKKIKKIIATLLVTCLLVNLLHSSTVNAGTENKIEIVYVDGVKYYYYLDKDNEFHVLDENCEAELVMNTDGEAVISSEDEEMTIEFQTLTRDDIEATVYDDEGEEVKEITDIDEIVDDSYEGQMLVEMSVLSYVASTLVRVLVVLAVTVVIYGALRYAASVIAKEVVENKRKQSLIYKAYIDPATDEAVYVDAESPITANQAKHRIMSGNNIYTFSGTSARNIVFATGMGVTEAELTKHRKKGQIYFYHFHTAGRNGAHAWFGRPYTG